MSPGQGLDLLESGVGEASHHIALEVELEVTAALRRIEEVLIYPVLAQEGLGEFGPDFVGPLCDCRADARGNALPLGAQGFHRRDRRVQDAGQGTAPSGVGRGDDPGLGFGEENRHAIGRQNADRQATRLGDHRVRLGRLARRPGIFDDDGGRRVDLMGSQKTAVRGVEGGPAHAPDWC